MKKLQMIPLGLGVLFVASLVSIQRSVAQPQSSLDELLSYSHRADVDLKAEVRRLAALPDQDRRILAGAVIGQYFLDLDRKTVCDVLVHLLSDPVPAVRLEAVGAVSRLSNLPPNFEMAVPDALDPVISRVKKLVHDKDSRIREEALDALSRWRSTRDYRSKHQN